VFTKDGPPPRVLAIVIDPGNVVVVLGLLTENEVTRLKYEILGGPVTGNNTIAMVLISFALLAAGAALTVVARRRTAAVWDASAPPN